MKRHIAPPVRRQEEKANAFLLVILFASIILFFASCTKSDSTAVADVQSNLQLVADNLVSPLSVVESPDDTKRLFIVDQVGKIYIVPNGGTMLATPFMDLTSKLVTLSPGYDERGLLSIAFHPNFKTNGKFYVFYTAPPRPGGPGAGWNSLTRISEFTVSGANANLADMTSERVLIEEDHPQLNHNGGTLAFGPDNYLYISIGDGGQADDVGNGMSLTGIL